MSCKVMNSPNRAWASCNFWEPECNRHPRCRPKPPCPWECRPKCCMPPWPHCCIPGKGELVYNGTFEIGVCGAGWECSGPVSAQDQIENTGHNAHQGTGAASLGLGPYDRFGDASISQVIRKGICPCIRYQFSFFMSPHSYAPYIDLSVNSNQPNHSGTYGHGEVTATVKFIDKCGNLIPNCEIKICIPGDTVAMANVWTYYKTTGMAPMGACGACIKISITDPAWRWQEHVHIDDVSLIAL